MSFTQILLFRIPSFFLGFIIVAFSIVLSIAGLLIVRRLIPHNRLKVHNDVATAIFGTLGMAYTVLLAFVVVIVWQSFDRSSMNAEREANCLVDLYRDSECFYEPVKKEVRALVKEYAQSVVDEEWKVLAKGEESPHARDLINKLNGLYSGYIPSSKTDETFFRESVGKLNELCELRRSRLFDSKTGIHPMLWFVLIIGGIATIGFTLFFGSENLKAQMLMTVLLAALISLILYTILMFDYPFTGDVRISSDAFREMFRY